METAQKTGNLSDLNDRRLVDLEAGFGAGLPHVHDLLVPGNAEGRPYEGKSYPGMTVNFRSLAAGLQHVRNYHQYSVEELYDRIVELGGIRPEFQCVICGTTCAGREELSEHREKKHGIKGGGDR